jgi:hypothetical protein
MPICNAGPFSTAAHPGEHLLLQIHADHLALRADQPVQGNREVAHAAAEVERGLARLHQPGEDTVGILLSVAVR